MLMPNFNGKCSVKPLKLCNSPDMVGRGQFTSSETFTLSISGSGLCLK